MFFHAPFLPYGGFLAIFGDLWLKDAFTSISVVMFSWRSPHVYVCIQIFTFYMDTTYTELGAHNIPV